MLGAPGFNGEGFGVAAETEEEIIVVPDSEWVQLCEAECCACNAAVHQKEIESQRQKHFAVSGDIQVAELVELVEEGTAEKESISHKQQATICQDLGENGGVGAPGEECVVVCVPEGNGNGNGNGFGNGNDNGAGPN